MKPRPRHILHLVACFAAIALCSCVTTSLETTAPDGSSMRYSSSQPAAGFSEAAAAVAAGLVIDQFPNK